MELALFMLVASLGVNVLMHRAHQKRSRTWDELSGLAHQLRDERDAARAAHEDAAAKLVALQEQAQDEVERIKRIMEERDRARAGLKLAEAAQDRARADQDRALRERDEANYQVRKLGRLIDQIARLVSDSDDSPVQLELQAGGWRDAAPVTVGGRPLEGVLRVDCHRRHGELGSVTIELAASDVRVVAEEVGDAT